MPRIFLLPLKSGNYSIPYFSFFVCHSSLHRRTGCRITRGLSIAPIPEKSGRGPQRMDVFARPCCLLTVGITRVDAGASGSRTRLTIRALYFYLVDRFSLSYRLGSLAGRSHMILLPRYHRVDAGWWRELHPHERRRANLTSTTPLTDPRLHVSRTIHPCLIFHGVTALKDCGLPLLCRSSSQGLLWCCAASSAPSTPALCLTRWIYHCQR